MLAPERTRAGVGAKKPLSLRHKEAGGSKRRRNGANFLMEFEMDKQWTRWLNRIEEIARGDEDASQSLALLVCERLAAGHEDIDEYLADGASRLQEARRSARGGASLDGAIPLESIVIAAPREQWPDQILISRETRTVRVIEPDESRPAHIRRKRCKEVA